MTPFLELNNVACHRNEVDLFSPIQYVLKEGQLLHLKGDNGVGKTTLLRCLVGLSSLYSGQINWCGSTIDENTIYQEQVAFLGHKVSLKSCLTVEENLKFTLPARNLTYSKMSANLEFVGLAQLSKVPVAQLSTGQKQRLALCKLILLDKKIWILDEPLTGLDQPGLVLFDQIANHHLLEQGLVIMTSHQKINMNSSLYSSIELNKNHGAAYCV